MRSYCSLLSQVSRRRPRYAQSTGYLACDVLRSALSAERPRCEWRFENTEERFWRIRVAHRGVSAALSFWLTSSEADKVLDRMTDADPERICTLRPLSREAKLEHTRWPCWHDASVHLSEMTVSETALETELVSAAVCSYRGYQAALSTSTRIGNSM